MRPLDFWGEGKEDERMIRRKCLTAQRPAKHDIETQRPKDARGHAWLQQTASKVTASQQHSATSCKTPSTNKEMT